MLFYPPGLFKMGKVCTAVREYNNRGYDYKYKQIYTEQATGLPDNRKRESIWWQSIDH